MSLLGDLLLQKTNAANQRQNMLAEMKARGIISGLGVLGPNGESPIDDSTIDAAGDELNKLVGKTPEGKGLVQQFTGLVKHLHGRVRGDQGQGIRRGQVRAHHLRETREAVARQPRVGRLVHRRPRVVRLRYCHRHQRPPHHPQPPRRMPPLPCPRL